MAQQIERTNAPMATESLRSEQKQWTRRDCLRGGVAAGIASLAIGAEAAESEKSIKVLSSTSSPVGGAGSKVVQI